jgi:Flp pilus assembly protein TadG
VPDHRHNLRGVGSVLASHLREEIVMPFSRPREDRGASAVEFALVVPLLLAVLFSIIDLGFAINRYTVLNNAAREGVRAASLSASKSEVDKVVNDSLSDLKGKVTVTVSCKTPLGGTCASWDANRTSGGVAVVTATYQHAWLTPMGKAVSSSLTLSKTSQMRIE